MSVIIQILPYLIVPAVIQFLLCQKAGKKARRRPVIITPITALVALALYPFFPSTNIITRIIKFFYHYSSRGWLVIDDDLIIIILYSILFFVGFCIGWLVYGVYILMKRTLDRRK